MAINTEGDRRYLSPEDLERFCRMSDEVGRNVPLLALPTADGAIVKEKDLQDGSIQDGLPTGYVALPRSWE